MRLHQTNGMLIIIAESAKDGYELGQLQEQATFHGKTLNVKVTGDSVAAAVKLDDHPKAPGRVAHEPG